MYSYAPISACKSQANGCVVALGCFDGVHIGHRQLLARAQEIASTRGLPLVVYSPEARKGQALLSTPLEKEALLRKLGANRVVFADFDKIKDLSAKAFVQSILLDTLGCQDALCGYNFTFGKMAKGNADTLVELMRQHGKDAVVCPAVNADGISVSSTRIRALLKEGNLSDANRLLCRPYSFSGTVTHGRAIGRTLGFPTLNLPIPSDKLVPKNGVYYSHVTIDNTVYGAIANIGIRPTFPDTPPVPLLEAHLLDFSADLYQKQISVELQSFLRPERAFCDVEALVQTVQNDIAFARTLAASDPILSKELT